MRSGRFYIFIIVSSVLAYLGCIVAVHDATPTTRSLQSLAPIVQWVSELGRVFNEHGFPAFSYSALSICIMLVLIGFQNRSRAQNLLFSSAICAVLGQTLMIDRLILPALAKYVGMTSELLPESDINLYLGIGFYVQSAILFFVGSSKSALPDPFAPSERCSSVFTYFDFGLLLAVFCVAIVMRMYALNHILDYFEGEISPYSAGATSLVGMLYAHEGWHGPWSPLGYLYYLPIYLTTSLFGTTLLALRLSSVLVGLMTIPLVYVLATRVAGRTAGHISAILFSLNFLHIGWHRSDIYPHGATTWPSILMCWCLLRASDTRSIWWAAAVALIMGLSWHQYPSGQSAVIIPLIAIVLSWFFNRSTRCFSALQAFVASSGLLLWAAGIPLTFYLVAQRWKFVNPFDMFGNRTIWGEAGETVSKLRLMWLTIERSLIHLWYVFEAMFVRARHIFHQEWLPYQPLFYPRTVGWIVLAFAVIGLFTLLRFRKRFESSVLLAWMMAAILPGILSSLPYPKRLSTFYPAVDITAAIGLATLCRVSTLGGRAWRRYLAHAAIAVASLAFLTFTTYAWFSGRRFNYGEPVETTVAAQLEQAITPGTLVLAELTRGYESGKYLYLMLDHLTASDNRPNMWAQCSMHDVQSFLSTAPNLERILETRWAYIWTKLRDQLGETLAHKDWEHVLFVLQRGGAGTTSNAALIEAVISRCSSPVISDIGPPSHDWNSLVLIKCPYADFANR